MNTCRGARRSGGSEEEKGEGGRREDLENGRQRGRRRRDTGGGRGERLKDALVFGFLVSVSPMMVSFHTVSR